MIFHYAECIRCSGRGWVHGLHPTCRKALNEMPVIELRVARKWAQKEQCPECRGRGKLLRTQLKPAKVRSRLPL